MDQSKISKAFKRVLKKAELPGHLHPHCLRHTYASLLLQQGESPVYVQRQLGHSSIQLTVDTYGRWLAIPPWTSAATGSRPLPRRVVAKW